MAFAFSLRTAASLLVVSSVSILGASTMITGCSSDSSGDNSDAAVDTCPTNITAAQGAACTTERMTCSLSYDCTGGDPLRETAECTCTNKAWACVDPKGNDVAAGQVPACTATGGGNDKQCPAAETEGYPCGSTGLVCSYAGATCPGTSRPNTDQCQCIPNNTDGGFLLHCEAESCPTPSDAGSGSDADAG